MTHSTLIPPQSAPVRTRRSRTGAGVTASDPANTCDCHGDQTFNKCKIGRNGCANGFYPVCDPGPYNCGCTCNPVGGG